MLSIYCSAFLCKRSKFACVDSTERTKYWTFVSHLLLLPIVTYMLGTITVWSRESASSNAIDLLSSLKEMFPTASCRPSPFQCSGTSNTVSFIFHRDGDERGVVIVSPLLLIFLCQHWVIFIIMISFSVLFHTTWIRRSERWISHRHAGWWCGGRMIQVECSHHLCSRSSCHRRRRAGGARVSATTD